MKKYRKKPVVIEAMQFTGDITPFETFVPCGRYAYDGSFFIQTLEGELHVSLNDWVIKGINGEFYPCKPDIFEKTYEALNE